MNHSQGPSSQRTAQLHEQLQARILSGEWPAGSRLPPERELAASYGTNRNTLREAIRRLEAQRLVSIRQGQGVTVLDFRATAGADIFGAFLAHAGDPREKAQALLDILEPRIRVLEYLVEQAVERHEPQDLAELEAILPTVREAESERDAARFMQAQIAWHGTMARATRNLPIRWITNPILHALEGIVRNWPQLALFEPRFSEYAQHILACMATRDRDTAVRITREFHEQVDTTLRIALSTLLKK